MIKKGNSISPTLDTLVNAADTEKWAVHPLCISKIMVSLAKYKQIAGRYSEALNLCQRAEAINPEKAGVKKMIEQLTKAIANQLHSAEDESTAAA